MKDSIISTLRDKNTGISEFRSASAKMANILANEAMGHIKQKNVPLSTPIASTVGSIPAQNIVLIPVLRSGLALLPVFLSYFDSAKVGFMGLKRDEKTFEPYEYYKNLPPIDKNDKVIILDPMIATGGSAMATIKTLRDLGILEEQILCVFLISAREGLDRLKREYPKVSVIVGVQDEELNADKYIVPGLGDFGDRYFGTL